MDRLFAAFLMLASLHVQAADFVDSTSTCQLNIQVPDLVSSARVLVLGEMHGTKETPALVGEYACMLAHNSATVIIGLEIATTEQGAIDTYLASDGSAKQRQKLIAGDFWQKSFQDGRSSQAMVSLIERLRQIKAIGSTVKVVAFAGGDSGATWDARMAGTLSKSIESFPDAKVVILTGNVHALKKKGMPFNPGLSPMTYLLAPLKPISMRVDYPLGTAWNCTSIGCGVHPIGYAAQPTMQPDEIVMTPGARDGYDGHIRVAAANASHPAKDGLKY